MSDVSWHQQHQAPWTHNPHRLRYIPHLFHLFPGYSPHEGGRPNICALGIAIADGRREWSGLAGIGGASSACRHDLVPLRLEVNAVFVICKLKVGDRWDPPTHPPSIAIVPAPHLQLHIFRRGGVSVEPGDHSVRATRRRDRVLEALGTYEGLRRIHAAAAAVGKHELGPRTEGQHLGAGAHLSSRG